MCSGSLHTIHSPIQQSMEQRVPAIWSALHTETSKLLKFVLTHLLKLAMHRRVQTICVSSLGPAVLLFKAVMLFNVRRYSPVTSFCVYISYHRPCQCIVWVFTTQMLTVFCFVTMWGSYRLTYQWLWLLTSYSYCRLQYTYGLSRFVV